MAPKLHSDLLEFLRLLNSHSVEYLLVGGYAVSLHGYPRATEDLDVWVNREPDNAARIVAAIREFGFGVPNLRAEIFEAPQKVIRMGVAPVKIELLTSIDGVDFADCLPRAEFIDFEAVSVPVICLSDLRKNKAASGRHRDLDDLEHLPEA